MNDNVENNIEETTADNSQENSSENTQQEELSIEPRVVEETKEKQVGIEGEILPDETSEATTSTENSTVVDESTETTTLTETASKPDSMSIPFIGLSVIQCIVAFLLIVVVLQQSKSASGITSSSIVGGDSQSYWNQNKGRSKESKLARLTIILGVIFFIVTIALGFVR
ncbi:preprotein translocase subunit SecG [uncultured Tyzzerella sp.]|uniref:preprotein translocase subunit SecG n=1 Tax=uncultured Tyzzerella sp. TaxID=2321398 RepID=UPI002941F687|nr:preprotein translocase subunit SecG [uncultured Tyzzerella sp.]